jgi:pimeloyl-ACP methyl ester carboxylesterase
MSRMETVQSRDGTRIAVEVRGEGPALVLVHGTSADRTRWAPVLPMLERTFTTYAVDRRGRGLSGDAPAYSIEREYEDIAAVAGSVPGPVSLLGHSYGALVCLQAALRAANLHRLVLYEPAFPVDGPIYPPGARERFQAMLDAGDREGMIVALFREIAGLTGDEIAALRKEQVWPARVAAAHTILREFADADYAFEPARFRDLDVPVLLLQGEESPAFLKAATAALHEALPRSRVAVMAGQGHAAMSTAPDLFARLVTEFLGEAP